MPDTVKNSIPFILQFIISIALFSIGIWEATVASANQNTNKLTSNEVQAYAFTTIKSIINILNSIYNISLLCSNEDSETSSDTKKSKTNIELPCINIGVGIWGLVMYSNLSKSIDNFGPFNIVIYVEFIIITIGLSCIGFIIIISCCTFSLLYIMNKNSNTPKIVIVNDNIPPIVIVNDNISPIATVVTTTDINNTNFNNNN